MNNPAANRRVRAATVSGSIAATAAIGLAAGAGPADAASFDAVKVKEINIDTGANRGPVNVGGTLFFSADDGTGSGYELWKSDGTTAGTTMVKDIQPGAGDSSPQYLTAVGGTLFFAADDGTYGKELWSSDGTGSGTNMVTDINTTIVGGGPNTENSSPRGLTNAGGRLFFSAVVDDATGREPWTSDGTSGGTTLVGNVNTSSTAPPYSTTGSSDPYEFTDVGGTVFFGAFDGTDDGTPGQHGRELWKTVSPFNDANTTRVTDLRAPGDSFPNGLIDVGGTLLFAATSTANGRELFKSETPFTSATLVEDINTTPDATAGSDPFAYDIGGTVLVDADDGINGREMWKTASPFDPGSTSLATDIYSGATGSEPYYFTPFGGSVLFSAYGSSGGRELWKTASPFDAPNTALLKDINPAGSSYPFYLTPLGSTLFFTAYEPTGGRELWSSDGTGAGTAQVKDIRPGAYGSDPGYLTDANGTLLFVASDDGGGNDLWKVIPAAPAGPAAPVSNQFSVVGKNGNKKKGSVQYTFNLPGGGVLSEKQAGSLSAEAVAAKGSVIKPASVTAGGAGPVNITIKPNKAGKSILAQKGKLRVSVKFTFTPTGGSPGSQTLKVLLKLT